MKINLTKNFHFEEIYKILFIWDWAFMQSVKSNTKNNWLMETFYDVVYFIHSISHFWLFEKKNILKKNLVQK
jgi:hypothetical protein